MSRPRVVFAMEWVPQYRVGFYEGLRKELDRRGVDMVLVHGDPPPSRKRRDDAEAVPWAEYVPNRFRTVAGLELTHQPVADRLRGADLVVVQQEVGLTLNYRALARARFGGPPVAVWGHGENFNPLEANAVAERLKRVVTPLADWAFAYTERSAEVFRSIGFDPARITVVQNSIDTAELDDPTGPVSDDVAALVARLRAEDARVAWIISALDRWKRVPFLLDVADRCAERIDRFAFLAVGSGDQVAVLEEAAADRPWLHPLGVRFGADKAALGELASITIHPGLVGLHVIDSFATGTPMVTADLDYHSHELAYLTDHEAVVLPADATAEDFATEVAGLFADPARLDGLAAGCRAAAAVYTLDAMVGNFADGVEAAIAAGRR